MKVELKKFGTTLISRQAGKEALASFQPTLGEIGASENLEIDFSGVITFSPSWGDEFLTPLHERFGDQIRLLNTANSSVKATISLLEQVNGYKFRQ